MGNSSSLPVAILGGGLTGLSAARALIRAGHRVRLFEHSDRLGGAVASELHPGGWLVEAGPNSLQETPAVAQLIRDLGLDSQRVAAQPAAKNRYIVRDGRPVPLPLSPPAFLRTPLFSLCTKVRLLTELLRGPRVRHGDVSIATLVREHFGTELVDYALNPFVAGIYAGDASHLSSRHAFPSLWQAEQTHGSLLRAQISAARAKRARGEPSGPPPIISFREGLGVLPRALAATLPEGSVELNARIARLTPPANGQPWQINWTRSDSVSDSQPSTLNSQLSASFSSVLLALPGHAIARLTIGTPGSLSSLTGLASIEYPPVTSLFLGYKREQVAHPLDGFGLLVPAVEKRSVLGILFNSSLFPDRAPAGHVALTVMIGGTRQPQLARLPDADLLAHVRRELAALLGVKDEPVLMRRHDWPHAIPQYNLGYDAHLATMITAEARYPGLFIGGHIRDGISMPACLAAGEKLAARVPPPR